MTLGVIVLFLRFRHTPSTTKSHARLRPVHHTFGRGCYPPACQRAPGCAGMGVMG